MKTLTIKYLKRIISPREVKERFTNFLKRQCDRLTPLQQLIAIAVMIILFLFLSFFSIGKAILNIRQGHSFQKYEHIIPVLNPDNNKINGHER